MSHLFGSLNSALRGLRWDGMVLVLILPGLGSAQSLAAMSRAQLQVQGGPLGPQRQVGFVLGWPFPEASWRVSGEKKESSLASPGNIKMKKTQFVP